jgi:hypothetical protein
VSGADLGAPRSREALAGASAMLAAGAEPPRAPRCGWRRLAAARLAIAATALTLVAACSGGPVAPSAQGTTPAVATVDPTTTTPPTTTPAPATTTPTATKVATAPPAAGSTLPRGDRTLLPKWRVVAYYGGPNGPALGVLGSGTPDGVFPRLAREAARWSSPGHPVLPAYELIAVIASAGPGPDGKYRSRIGNADIQRYLDSARRHKVLLVLDIQPGRANFLTEAKLLERWLVLPDVALAIDPEWRMAPNEIPGKKIGSVEASEVNAVSGWLNALTAAHKLPQKLLLVHQFTTGMVHNKPAVQARPNLAMVFNMDGFGHQAAKVAKYQMLAADKRFPLGMKLFYKQDINLFTPAQLMAQRPVPSMLEFQ